MKKRGFTLIELMVVIAIIGLLAAIALPRFAGVSDAAKIANVQGNLSSIRTSISMYQAKNDAYPIFAKSKDEDLSAVDNTSVAASGGKKFTDFYGKNILANTPGETAATTVADTNIVVEATSITGNKIIGDNKGGWAYVTPGATTTNAATGTGQIRANLSSDDIVYGEKTDWSQF